MTTDNKAAEPDIRLVKPLEEIWAEAKVLLKKKFSQGKFESWIRPVHLASLENGKAHLVVKTDFMRTMIGNYMPGIKEVLSQLSHQTVNVSISIDPNLPVSELDMSIANVSVIPANKRNLLSEDDTKAPDSPMVNNQTDSSQNPVQSAPVSANNKSRLSSPNAPNNNKSGLNPKYAFGSFVVGSHNRFCHSAAMAVAENPGQSYNPLFLYGGVGLGKTHIMQAIGHEALRLSPNLSVRYITCERFTNELINSIRDDRMVEFRRRYRQVDVLLVDDIQFIQGKESTQEEFFHTFNALRDNGSQIVLTSDRPPKAISHLEERLRSRFEWGLIADIQAPDLETRVAILRKKSEMEKMHIPEDVIEYIASTFTSNIRELEGALLRAYAYSNMTGTELSVRALGSILAPVGPSTSTANITLDSIIEAVSQHYRIEPSEMRSVKRSADLALPRHVAMYLAHDLIQLSFPRIGQAFANRKHTSAMYAHTRIKEARLKDPDVAQAVNQIINKLNS